ncbi:hypothetical protein F5Y11DRAFT_366587 [Daldinia sp. FL1419]|nr:hypothetical protein F5Y11DRAFT_366587 [Daldinia sp. FL1419]
MASRPSMVSRLCAVLIGAPALTSCQLSTKRFFESLPDPTTNERHDDAEQDRQYIGAIRIFLKKEAGSSAHDDECTQLKSIISKALENQVPHGIRVAFIEASGFLVMGIVKYDAQSAKTRYLSECKWVFQGRKNKYICGHSSSPSLAASPDSNGDSDDECESLPLTSTTPLSCAFCGSQGTLSFCEACSNGSGPQMAIGVCYCGESCRLIHEPLHKSICQLRRRFIQATLLVKSLLGIMEEFQTLPCLEGSYERNGIIFLKEKPRYIEAMLGKPVVGKFRSGSVAKDHVYIAMQDQYLLDLGFIASSTTQTWLWQGLVEEVEQFAVLVKNAHRTIIRHTARNTLECSMLRPHTVLCVTLSNGDKFAVDYACGRFGWAETVTHWEHFVKYRVQQVIWKGPPGAWELDPVNTIPAYLPERKKAEIHAAFMEDTLRELHGHLRCDFPRVNIKGNYHRSFNDKEWGVIETEFLAVARRNFEESHKKGFGANRDIKYRMYLDADFEVRVEHDDDDREYLEKIWLNERQIENFKHLSIEDMKRQWKTWLFHVGAQFKHPEPSASQIEEGATVFKG